MARTDGVISGNGCESCVLKEASDLVTVGRCHRLATSSFMCFSWTCEKNSEEATSSAAWGKSGHHQSRGLLRLTIAGTGLVGLSHRAASLTRWRSHHPSGMPINTSGPLEGVWHLGDLACPSVGPSNPTVQRGILHPAFDLVAFEMYCTDGETAFRLQIQPASATRAAHLPLSPSSRNERARSWSPVAGIVHLEHQSTWVAGAYRRKHPPPFCAIWLGHMNWGCCSLFKLLWTSSESPGEDRFQSISPIFMLL